jgi:glycosyltransferase involved in cell wall biosynthesis
MLKCAGPGGTIEMIKGKKVVVVCPAYNAEKTIRRTHAEIMAQGVVDRVVVVDDASTDGTAALARDLANTTVIEHPVNRGYGGNQKTCYAAAMAENADIIIMVHPDYQYTPKLIPAMASIIANGLYNCVMGSRILGGQAISGGMPPWKYAANRFLTLVENLLTGAKLSEYHSGYRAFSRQLLSSLPLDANSDDFIFDNQMLAQILWKREIVAEISCPTLYFKDASSIGFRRSVKYGLGCIHVGLAFRLARLGLARPRFLRGI